MKVFSSTIVCGVLRAVEKDPVIVIVLDGTFALLRPAWIGVLELYFGVRAPVWLDDGFDIVSPMCEVGGTDSTYYSEKRMSPF